MSEKRGGILYVCARDRPGNYLTQVLEVALQHPPAAGTINHVSIAHDDWCSLLAGKGACDCAPIVTFLERNAKCCEHKRWGYIEKLALSVPDRGRIDAAKTREIDVWLRKNQKVAEG